MLYYIDVPFKVVLTLYILQSHFKSGPLKNISQDSTTIIFELVTQTLHCSSKSLYLPLLVLLFVYIYIFSAGIGRTGTFIAIDALYENGQKTGYIDIMEYVQMMRKDRMNMIQTKVSVVSPLFFIVYVMRSKIDDEQYLINSLFKTFYIYVMHDFN